MILKQNIYLPKYDWDVVVYYNTICVNCILSSLEDAGCSKRLLKEFEDFLNLNKLNTGFTYTNPSLLESVLVIGKASSFGEFINTVEHEKNHLEMHICKHLNIDPHSEEAAILSGTIALIFLDRALSTIIDTSE